MQSLALATEDCINCSEEFPRFLEVQPMPSALDSVYVLIFEVAVYLLKLLNLAQIGVV